MAIRDALLPAIRSQIDAAASAWLDDALTQTARGPVPQLLRAYTEASRYLGRAPLGIDTGTLAGSAELADISLSHWTVEDAGRLLLLLARYEVAPDASEPHAAAIDCYEQGDAREQLSWLRAVALLPQPERFLAVAIDACRTSIVPVFEAIACENPYPAKHFPERNFNQLVLKALFNGIALNRIAGLPARLNPDLSRMARDYAAERRAAGRTIPPDISLAMLDGMAAQRTDR